MIISDKNNIENNEIDQTNVCPVLKPTKDWSEGRMQSKRGESGIVDATWVFLGSHKHTAQWTHFRDERLALQT